MDMLKTKTYRAGILILTILFLFFSIWFISFLFLDKFQKDSYVLLSEVYGLVALFGGIYGLIISKSLGGFKSYFGKAIIFMSLGLLLQEFGQLAYSYLNSIKHVAVPYPSWPDIGFFGSIPCYILGAYFLAKGLNVGGIIRKTPWKLVASVLLSAMIMSVSYWQFLKGYQTAGTPGKVIFFDFGYPLGQAIYVSIAVATLLSVRGLLGGLMRKPVLLLLFAFLLQYTADSNFIYQTIHETWGPAGYGDFIYMTAYYVLGLSIILVCLPITRLRSSSIAQSTTTSVPESSEEAAS